jgi:hypothetical protein
LEIDDSGESTVMLLGNDFDIEKGIVLEGTMEIHSSENKPGGIGLYIEENTEQGTAIMLQTYGRTEIGQMRIEGKKKFQPDDVIETTGITSGKKCAFRLLLRQYLMELYLNDLLVQCYSLPLQSTGHLGLIVESGRAVFEKLQAWEMN